MSKLVPLDPLLEGYLDYLRGVRRQAAPTVADTRCTLRRVCAVMAELRPEVPLWKLSLEDYLCWLERERQAGRTTSCLGKYLSHLRGLLDYAWRSGRADRNVLDGFALQDDRRPGPPDTLGLEEAARLVAACTHRTPTERRDRVIILMLYGCGLRTQELCRLNIEHVDIERHELFVAHGKGDRQRTIPIPEAVFTELLAYLHERGGRRGPLFRTPQRHARLLSSSVSAVVRQIAERAGLHGKITPRTLRHSYATHLMDAGVNLAVISSLMGHRSPSETGVYLHVLEDRPREAVRQLPLQEGERP